MLSDRGTRITLLALFFVLAASASYLYLKGIGTGDEVGYGDVSVEEAMTLIEEKPGLVILDVRTGSEFQDGHIEGAINIPVGELDQRLSEISPNDEYLVYCRTGNRSTTAVEIMKEKGYLMIYHMDGGITAWTQAGLSTINN
ncbi:MAG: rhodanese-like domain-containing protein [Candidatus Bathyarchaeota archaeon]|jgi:rhodanese-related sulfurtransferase